MDDCRDLIEAELKGLKERIAFLENGLCEIIDSEKPWELAHILLNGEPQEVKEPAPLTDDQIKGERLMCEANNAK